MPSKSQAQHNLMAMVANNPEAAKRLGIPQSVGKEYIEADKGKKLAKALRKRDNSTN
jgi:predicted transcriptional regulator